MALTANCYVQAKDMTSNLITYRFGRFAIDLPRTSNVIVDGTYRGAQISNDSDITSFSELKDKLDSIAHKFASTPMQGSVEYAKMLRKGGLDPSKLIGSTQLLTYRLDPAASIAIFAFHPELSSTDVTVDAYKVTESGTYKFQVIHRIATDLEKYAANLRQAANSFKSYKEASGIPAGAFCISSGCFDDKGAKPFDETIDLVGTIGGHPDAKLRIYLDAKTTDNQLTYDPRNGINDTSRTLAEFGIHPTVLRAGERSLAGQHGYEVIESLPDPDNKAQSSYVFIWAANGKVQDPKHPIVKIDLRIASKSDGTSTVSSVSEAVKIWENILGTFRAM